MKTLVHTRGKSSLNKAEIGPSVILQRKCACLESPSLECDCDECRKSRLSLQHNSPSSQPGIKNDLDPSTTLHDLVRQPRFPHDFSRVRVEMAAPSRVQSRIEVSQPGDVYEREAERVADQVIRMPEPAGNKEAAALGLPCSPKIRSSRSGREEQLQRQTAEEQQEEDSGQPVDGDMPTPDELTESPQPALKAQDSGIRQQRLCRQRGQNNSPAREVGIFAQSADYGALSSGGEPLNPSVRSYKEASDACGCDTCKRMRELGVRYALRKLPDGSCVHLDGSRKCSIYKDRPQTCRNYSCVNVPFTLLPA